MLKGSKTNTAVILVGGKGTRLQSVVSDVPKPLANVAGEPFLFLLLKMLAKEGIEKIILLTGYMHEKIVAACQDGKQFGVQISYSHEHAALGTAGALRNAEKLLNNLDDFILMNGDTYLNCSIKPLLSHPLPTDVLGILSVCQPEETQRFGTVILEPPNIIKAFLEKDSQSSGLVNAGIYKLSCDILPYIPKNQFCSLETDIFPQLAVKKALHGLIQDGLFYDIGTPESYAAFNTKIKL